MDDDDEFLYGDASPDPVPIHTFVSQPVSLEKIQQENDRVNRLEEKVGIQLEDGDVGKAESGQDVVDGGEEDEQGGDEDSEDDDVEIIMEPTARSLDFRQNSASRPPAQRSTSSSLPTANKAPQPSLTTEYTPHQRGGITSTPTVTPYLSSSHLVPASSHTSGSQPPPGLSSNDVRVQGQNEKFTEEGPDPSSLPPTTAPPSHPAINPSIAGILDGRSILEVDLAAMSEKPWRRPGSDISDWFNYGFDELSWEAYCYRRRDLGELGNVLKATVLNVAGMPEDQLLTLPPEVRQMVMTTALMTNGGPGPGMMGPGVVMNPMMDMSGMMGPMGIGMNGEMGIQMQPGGTMMQVPDGRQMMDTRQMMQEGQGQGVGSGVGAGNGAQELGGQMMQDVFTSGGPAGMMNMGISGDFNMQESNPMGQPMYPTMESNVAPGPGPGPGTRGGTPVPYRGRGMQQNMGPRGRGGFAVRGRGRGMYGGAEGVTPVPVRPASPLPPGVPTGPRNQNKYKDRDGNAPAVDGLDYGGNNKDGGGRTPSGEPEDRGSSRKRRSSPGLDDGRGSKRR